MVVQAFVIVGVYCFLQLMWRIENARVGTAGTPHPALTWATIGGVVVIAVMIAAGLQDYQEAQQAAERAMEQMQRWKR